ncbi:hypothetical protein Pan258_03360 [Symmachiella dynata]|uniref:Uncharacterized protein n=1 Tax=Symmachiella dynata TaxID=2527995 RepID=A0A517ZH74_9PLAN|nr:hypothetical protein Pan258_03360 [Symmachiella dynata]QDU41824.1 hypothetical protein Mal52_02780 [Symmachiella dynata]
MIPVETPESSLNCGLEVAKKHHRAWQVLESYADADFSESVKYRDIVDRASDLARFSDFILQRPF